MSAPLFNKTIPISSQTYFTDFPSLPTINESTITAQSYNPRYKCEDKAAALLTAEGITDSPGKVDRYLVDLPQIPLSLEERARLEHYFNIYHEVLSSWESLKIEVTARDVIKDLFGPIFDEVEIIGSAAFQAMGVSFCKRFMAHLLELAFTDQNDRVPVILNQLFTPEYETSLEKRFNRKLADIDTRLTSANPPNNAQPIHHAINASVIALIKKLPLLSEKQEKERRVSLLEILKQKVPALDWQWVNVMNPNFYEIALRSLAFNKLAISTKEGEHLGILNFGNPTATTIDIVFALKLPRSELFPAVQIPCRSLLEPHRKDCHVYPKGKNWVQAVLDKMTGRVRPDVSTATEADLQMLLCYKTKGEINPVEGSERTLIDIARKESLNRRNKTIHKILKQHPELGNKLKEAFPYFLAQLLKDAVDTHLHKDPLAAIAITLNAIDMFEGVLSISELSIFITEMQKTWLDKTGTHLLYHLAYLLGEKHLLPSHDALIHKLPLIKLSAFLRCQAKNDETSEVLVYPRQNAGKPCLEVIIKGESRNYSLLLSFDNTAALLRDAVKYVNLPRPDHSSIKRLLMAFQTTYAGPWTSEMLDDLPILGHQPEIFERFSQSMLLTYPLLGTLLFFATQSQIGATIPMDQMLVNLPRIASGMKGNLSFLQENLCVLISNNDQKRAVNQLIGFLKQDEHASENAIAERWISLMSSVKEWNFLSHQCFLVYFHQNQDIPAKERTRILLKHFDLVKQTDLPFAAKLLAFAQQKKYLLFGDIIIPFGFIRDSLIKDLSVPYCLEILVRLEQIAEDSHSSKSFKKENVSEFKEMVAPLLSHSKRLSQLIESFDRVERQEAALQSQQPASESFDIYANLSKLSESDYEEAANAFFLFATNQSFPPNANALLPILHRILQEACQDRNYRLAVSLLKKPAIRDYFTIRPERYVAMLLAFHEECLNNGLVELAEVCLETVLKGFKPGEPLCYTPPSELLIRLVEYIIRTLESSHPDKSKELKRAFSYAFESLFSSLQAKDLSLECVRIYHLAFLLNDTQALQKNANLAIASILAVKTSEKNFLLIQEQVEAVLQTLSGYAIDLNKYEFYEVIVTLLIYNNSPEKIKFYLDHLFESNPLVNEYDLELLLELYEDFKEKDIDAALALLEAYKGPVLSHTQIPEANGYLNDINKMVVENDWVHACHAIAINPFTWNDPEKISLLKSFSERSISGLLEKGKLSLEELKWIIAILQKHDITDTRLIYYSIEKCESILDVSLAKAIWSIFIDRGLKDVNDLDLQKPFVTLLKALKLLSKSEIEAILDNSEVIEYAADHVAPEHHLAIFKGLFKANLSLIKAAKATDRPNLLDSLDIRVISWIDTLSLDVESVDFNQGLLDVVDYYLSLPDNHMIPGANEEIVEYAADHLYEIRDLPEIRERYYQILCRFVARLSKTTERLIADKVLSKILSEAIRMNVPFISLGKCLYLCQTKDMCKTGVQIVKYCAVSFTISEIRQIASLKLGNFLKYALEFCNEDSWGEIVSVVETNKNIRLFMTQEEYHEVVSLAGKFILDKGIAITKENGHEIGHLIVAMIFVSKHLGIIAKNEPETFEKYTDTLIDITCWGEKDFDILINLFKILDDHNDLSVLCNLAEALSSTIIPGLFNLEARDNLLRLIDLINTTVLSSRGKTRALTKDHLKGLKTWVTLLLSYNTPVTTQLAIDCVHKISLDEKHTIDLLEMQVALMIIQRHKIQECLDNCRSQADHLHKIISDTIFRYRDIGFRYTPPKFHEDCKFAVECFNEIPHKESDHTIASLFKLCFTTVTLNGPDFAASWRSLKAIWLKATELHPKTLMDTLSVYIASIPQPSINMLEKKLDLLIEHIKTKPSFLTNESLDAIYVGIPRFLQALMNDPATNEQDISKVINIYMNFFARSKAYYQSPKDFLTACEGYVCLLDHLTTVLKYRCLFKRKSSLEDFKNNFEQLFSEISNVPTDLRDRYKRLEVNARQKIKVDFADIYTRHKAFLKK